MVEQHIINDRVIEIIYIKEKKQYLLIIEDQAVALFDTVREIYRHIEKWDRLDKQDI